MAKPEYAPKKFLIMGDGDRPFPLSSQKAVDLLEGIMPAEKAQAVPFVLIWEIDPKTGEPRHKNPQTGLPRRPLSLITVEPPKFGAAIQKSESNRFRERPPVSLERLTVKTQNPRGIILYRTLELSFVVHQPDIIFEQHVKDDGTHIGDGDSWSTLVTPGEVFGLEYGWTAGPGVKNGILNGNGYTETRSSKEPGPNESAGPDGIAIPGRERMKFIVTNYNFNVNPDLSIKFNIQGFELGEFNLRQAFLSESPQESDNGFFDTIRDEIDPYENDSYALKKLLKKIQDNVGDQKVAGKNVKKGDRMVPFGLLLDCVFADPIRKAFVAAGFQFDSQAGIVVGNLNARAGVPAKKYAAGKDMSNKPISDFTIPMGDIEKVFEDLIKLGTRLTLYNFLEPFLRLIERPDIWDRSDDRSPETKTIPQLVTRTIQTGGSGGKKQKITFYIFDANREYTKFSKDDWEKGNENLARSEIRKKVNGKGLPYISLGRANSYIKEAPFEVVQDEQMKGIFMRRYFGDKGTNREQKTSTPNLAQKENKTPPAQQIFSPAIKGRITMLGNFVIGTFALVWIDFGVRLWDGPFTTYEREDVIERGSFLTTMSVYSAGTDPLGTQGRSQNQ